MCVKKKNDFKYLLIITRKITLPKIFIMGNLSLKQQYNAIIKLHRI